MDADRPLSLTHVALAIWMCLVVFTAYAGFAGWSFWALPPLAVMFAINKATNKLTYAAANDDGFFVPFVAITAVNIPIMLVLAGIIFLVGRAVGGLLAS